VQKTSLSAALLPIDNRQLTDERKFSILPGEQTFKPVKYAAP
jgi:hypothetical protein